MSMNILSSNSNSSLLNSLTSSPAMVNPTEYSLGKITPFHSKITVKHTAVSGSLSANTSARFALNKFGVISRMIVGIKATNPSASIGSGISALAVKHSYYGILESIISMEQMSSSRVIHTLTKEAIKAIISDLPSDVRQAVINGLQGLVSGTTASNTTWTTGVMCYIPCFFSTLSSPDKYIDSEFTEPMSVQINFSNKLWGAYSVNSNGSAGTFHRPELSDMTLYVDYLNFTASERDAVLSKNYVDDTLSILSYDYDSSESSGVGDTTLSSSASSTCKTFIKNTGSITDIYVYAECEENPANTVDMAQTNVPLILEDIKLYGSGSEILNLNAEIIQLFGKTTTDGHFFATRGYDGSEPSRNIYKIQLGLDSSGRDLPNAMSLRELNNVYVEATVKNLATNNNGASNLFKPILRVVLKKLEVITIDGSNGRLTKSINA